MLPFWQRLRLFLLSPMAVMTSTYVLTGFGSGILYPYFGLFFVQHLGANSAFFGIMSGSSNALLAFATLLTPWMVMRIDRLKTIVLTSSLSLPFILCMGIVPILLPVTILYLLFQVLWNMANGILELFSMEIVPPKLQGRANSIYQVAFQGTSAAATPLGGLLIAHLGYTPVFWITTVLFLLAEILLWWRFAGKRFVIPEVSTEATKDGQDEDERVIDSSEHTEMEPNAQLR
jgi:MFS family permease